MLFSVLLTAAIVPAGAATVPSQTPPLSPSASTSTWIGPPLSLNWDIVHRTSATESTVARVATDGRSLYVRFDAVQKEPITANQHSNDLGGGNDDAVRIDLFPNATAGYAYQFEVTPNGSHNAISTENTAYSPIWQSDGALTANGYVATMKIPLDVIRGVHPGQWRMQLVRYVHASGAQYVWHFDPLQTNPDDSARAGVMVLPQNIITTASRPKPRFATYALVDAIPRTYGGTTSRVGADISVPISSTASFYATFHPDSSNVELDQQTISPSVSPRFYTEVRPFFTQAANTYNRLNCDVCVGETQLYTPAIPTPTSGYAVEGKEGQFGFASFDAIGIHRNDTASVLDYTSPDTKWLATVQHQSVNTQSLVDDSTAAGISYYDLKHASFYVDYGRDAGTRVIDPSESQWQEAGGGWASKTFGFYGAVRKMGTDYDPVDGYFSHPGIAGYGLFAAKIFDFDENSKLESAGISEWLDRYQGPTQGSAQSDNQLLVDVLTKRALDLQVSTGSDYWRFGNVLAPISQSAGFSFTYGSGMQTNNPGNFPAHGNAAMPTQIKYVTGRYGDGRLETWYRTSTVKAGNRGLLTLAVDDTAQSMPHDARNVQWFDSMSYAYQIGPTASFAIGLRRVAGNPPVPNGGGNCVGSCTNISLAFHLRLNTSELYFAYGDPNTLTTMPQLLVKMIFYEGASKGT